MQKVTIPLYVLVLLIVFAVADLAVLVGVAIPRIGESKTPVLTGVDKINQNGNAPAAIEAPAAKIEEPAQTYDMMTAGRWPGLSQTVMTAHELAGYSISELELMRNEIYARHGYIFKLDRLRQYFESQKWYRGTISDQQTVYNSFNAAERENVKQLLEYENFLRSQQQ